MLSEKGMSMASRQTQVICARRHIAAHSFLVNSTPIFSITDGWRMSA